MNGLDSRGGIMAAAALAMVLSLSVCVMGDDSQTECWPTAGWVTAAPDEQGMDSRRLDVMQDYVGAHEWGNEVDSILVVRNGCLVYEYYPSASYDADDRHHIFSCTKSFLSALIGIAVREGYIEGLDARVLDFFPDLGIQIRNLDQRKEAITIRDLLTMTSGLAWHDSTDYYKMEAAPDWAKYVLDQSMAQMPGTRWNYNTGGTHLLSTILNRTCPEGVVAFAESELFHPLGITDYVWVTDNGGIPIGGTGLNLCPRDMAKFGYLYLRKGCWDGQQIIPQTWVAESTTTMVPAEFDEGLGTGYGYLWWTYVWDGAYAARGTYQQYIIIVPGLDMVVVFTGSGDFPATTLLARYVLASAGYRPNRNSLWLWLIALMAAAVPCALASLLVARRTRLRGKRLS